MMAQVALSSCIYCFILEMYVALAVVVFTIYMKRYLGNDPIAKEFYKSRSSSLVNVFRRNLQKWEKPEGL